MELDDVPVQHGVVRSHLLPIELTAAPHPRDLEGFRDLLVYEARDVEDRIPAPHGVGTLGIGGSPRNLGVDPHDPEPVEELGTDLIRPRDGYGGDCDSGEADAQ